MNIEKRIRALEARLSPRFITLTMPDGSTRRIPGNGQHLLRLVCDAARRYYCAGHGETTVSELDDELDLIAESISDDAHEQGCGQMVHVARLALTADPGDPEVNRVLDEGDVGDGDDE